jgi:hypothetical protein
MRRSSPTILLLVAVASLSVGCTRDRCVTFDAQALGAQFPPPSPPGVVFTEQGIPVSIQDFLGPTGATTVGYLRIELPTSGVGSGKVLRANNANAEFNLTSVANTKVQFKFLDLGGYENLSINGAPAYVGDIAAAPASWPGGVTMSVSTIGVPGGQRGIVTLQGNVKRLRVGGQEFFVDDVCVKPRKRFFFF